MSNEELYEYYGWKAHKYGFFEEWRNRTSEKMTEDPKRERSLVSQDVFVKLINEKGKSPVQPVYLQS